MAVVTQPILVNSYEGNTPGSPPGADLGGASGPGQNLGTAAGFGWDSVVVSAGSAMVIDTSKSHSGRASGKITTTSGVTCYTAWNGGTVLQAAGPKVWFRRYLYFPANPGTQHQVLSALVSGSAVADLGVNTAGKLYMRARATGSNVVITTASVPLNQWFRVEGFIFSDASAGQVQVQLFSSPDSVTADETQTSAASLNTLGGNINQLRPGLGTGGVTGVDFNFDDDAVSFSGPVGPGAIVQLMQCGAPSQKGFTVISKPVGGTSCRLKVATDQALTQNVTFAAAQAPDQYGYVQHQVTGLAPGTQYYCAIADTPNGGSEMICGPLQGAIKTLPPAGSPQSFRVSFASCVDNADETPSPSIAIDDWITWNADLKVHLGDFGYYNPVFTNVTDHLAVLEEQALYYDVAGMTATGWGYVIRSDHDTGLDNGDSGPVSAEPQIPFNLAAWQEFFPAGTLGDTTYAPVHGLYQAWVIGRVRFIMLDIRTQDRSPGASTDNSSKTMLGATQLAWFENQLIQPEPLKVIIDDTAWMGAFLSSDLDKWWSYSTERSAILSFITANAARAQGVMWWHGDTHGLGCSTGAQNSSYGGFPVYCAAPLRQSGAAVPNSGTFGQFYNNSGGECRQYGRVTFTDDGGHITVHFSGWDALNGVEQIAQTDTFSCPPAAPARGGAFAAGLS